MSNPVDLESVRVGFIGLGNASGKLAGSLLRNGVDVTVGDLDDELVADFVGRGPRSSGYCRC